MTPVKSSRGSKAPKEAPNAEQIKLEIQCALDAAVLVAEKHGAYIAGFVWSLDPLYVFNFGNCKDQAAPRTFELLCEMVADATAEQTTHHRIQEPS